MNAKAKTHAKYNERNPVAMCGADVYGTDGYPTCKRCQKSLKHREKYPPILATYEVRS